LPGIPCLYYGTEQGLHGSGSDPAVLEALWGGPGFQQDSFYYKQISQIAKVRAALPALRYGRFYFRPISGDGQHFGISTFSQGILAFSRILMDEEVVIVANCSSTDAGDVDVIVDITLNQPADPYRVRYSNKSVFQSPAPVQHRPAGSVSIREADGSSGGGPVNSIRVSLAPLEVQVLGR
jgi:glycosidase